MHIACPALSRMARNKIAIYAKGLYGVKLPGVYRMTFASCAGSGPRAASSRPHINVAALSIKHSICNAYLR